MAARTYKCWDCHKPGFLADELEAHRCRECRDKRRYLRRGGGQASPWTADGLRVWDKREMGPDSGVRWKRRRKAVSCDSARKQLAANEKLPTTPED